MVDFEQFDEFRREFRSWLQTHVPREPEPADTAGAFEFRRSWQRLLFDHGWAGIAWPTEYGGRDATPFEQFTYYEELAYARAPKPVNEPGMMFFGPALMVHGSEMLKRRYLPSILSADDVFCQGFSEPDAGSDLASLRTSAELGQDDDLLVTGQKTWSTWAPYADRCALLCRTDPTQDRHRGLSLMILDLHQEGVLTPPIRQITGQEEFGEIHLDRARVRRDHVVGGLHDGWRVAMTLLEFERSDVGLHDHARIEVFLGELRTRLVAGRDDGSIGADAYSALRAGIADAFIRCQCLRELNRSLSQRRTHGERIADSGSVVRLYWSDLAQAVGTLAMEVAGPDSGLDDDLAHNYLYSRSLTIASGTSQIQRNIVGERVLALPR